MAHHDPSRVVNYGAYGVILSPALPNDPPYENDPHSMITKVFYRKEDYDALRKKEKRLAKILGVNEEGYRTQSYERTWRMRNLPERAQDLLAEQQNEEIKNDQSMYAVRMLHLGSSVSSLRASPDALDRFRTCSISSLIKAIQKSYRTLASLARHHSLPGDIHPGNVLVYMAPPYVDFSLIDYDRFSTYQEFKQEYQAGRRDLYGGPEIYSLLPEELRTDPWILRAYQGRFLNNRYVEAHYPAGQWDRLLREAAEGHGDKPIPLSTQDSFLLSGVLLDLLYRAFPPSSSILSPQEDKSLRATVEVLEEGFRITDRIGPDEMVSRLQRIGDRTNKEENTRSDQPNQPTRKNQTTRNKNQNRCTVSGGRMRRNKRHSSKTRIISRKGRR